jgi:hypothetical protein
MIMNDDSCDERRYEEIFGLHFDFVSSALNDHTYIVASTVLTHSSKKSIFKRSIIKRREMAGHLSHSKLSSYSDCQLANHHRHFMD